MFYAVEGEDAPRARLITVRPEDFGRSSPSLRPTLWPFDGLRGEGGEKEKRRRPRGERDRKGARRRDEQRRREERRETYGWSATRTGAKECRSKERQAEAKEGRAARTRRGSRRRTRSPLAPSHAQHRRGRRTRAPRRSRPPPGRYPTGANEGSAGRIEWLGREGRRGQGGRGARVRLACRHSRRSSR